MTRIQSLGLVAISSIFSLSVVPAFAATDEEVVDVLIESTVIQLDVQVEDSTLLDEIASDLEYAISEEVLDPDIVETISAAIDAEEEADLTELVDENLEEQLGSWLDRDPSLLSAFELVKYEFHKCRAETNGPANQCARGLGDRLQLAAVEVDNQKLEELKASIESLSGEELAAAEEEIALLEDKVSSRTERIEERTARKEESAAAKDQKAQGQNSESANETPGKSGEKPEKDKGNSGSKGNSGGNGKSGK